MSSDQLSPREKEVLDLIEKGHSNQEIASLLQISIGTVKTHLKAIFTKKQVNTRNQLIAQKIAELQNFIDQEHD